MGRFGLELTGCRDPRDQRGVDADGLVAAEIVPQLSDQFDERKALNVAYSPADLADDEVAAVGVREREFLDRVRNVRDHLDGRSEIVATPLLGDDVAIYSAGGDIVRLARRYSGEPLVMAEV